MNLKEILHNCKYGKDGLGEAEKIIGDEILELKSKLDTCKFP